jgi:hypothetical protein
MGFKWIAATLVALLAACNGSLADPMAPSPHRHRPRVYGNRSFRKLRGLNSYGMEHPVPPRHLVDTAPGEPFGPDLRRLLEPGVF